MKMYTKVNTETIEIINNKVMALKRKLVQGRPVARLSTNQTTENTSNSDSVTHYLQLLRGLGVDL